MTILLTLVTAAWPCAGLVHEEGALAEARGSAVLFQPFDTTVTVTYEVVYDGDAADFGWVIPVSGPFVSIVDADESLFGLLREATAPTVIRDFGDAGGGGCAASKSDAGGRGGDTAEFNGVDVVAEGFTGSWEYVALTATEADALRTWLTDHGWALEAGDAIEHYVALGDTFVALRVAPSIGATPDEGRALPPVAITYGGTTMRFPAYMAQWSGADPIATTVWVRGNGPAKLTDGWTASPMYALAGGIDDDGAAVFEAALAAKGADRGYAITWSGAWAGAHLTRFDTVAPRTAHTVDATFAPGGDAPDGALVITLTEEGGTSGAPLALLGAGALAIAFARRWSRG